MPHNISPDQAQRLRAHWPDDAERHKLHVHHLFVDARHGRLERGGPLARNVHDDVAGQHRAHAWKSTEYQTHKSMKIVIVFIFYNLNNLKINEKRIPYIL